MSNLIPTEGRIPAMTEEAVNMVREFEAKARKLQQVDIPTDHVIHGGMYARTIPIPAGVVLTGVFIQVPTILVLDGDVTVNAGDQPVRLTGRRILAASANRRQVFFAHADSILTMLFATQAKTVSEAEDEFTNEAHLLMSRQPDAVNHVTITGE
ncbi:MAG: hypothetical protein PHW66_06390 [Gallionella sp.]|nr:hypothetical protein [Gallionella sp.]